MNGSSAFDPDRAPASLLTEWARLLLGSLRAAGVRDVVVSPGSRSTPFTWAALRDPGLRCRTIIDERSAAFFAVGHARITGDPVLLICTSGSAAANYFPALVEASAAAVPVLVLTSDRPLELQHAAAPQTLDQVKLYGDHARRYVELGTPDPDPRMLRALPRLAAQAVLDARSPSPGPVHLNARARKPLEPRNATGAAAGALRATVDRLLDDAPRAYPADPAPSAGAVTALAAACRGARRGLIVLGPSAPVHAAGADAVRALARRTGFPVVAEAASQLRLGSLEETATLDAFATLLEIDGFADAHAPDLILQLGRPPTASSWNAAIEAWTDTRRWVIAPHDWADPWNTATAVVRAPVDAAVRALLGRLETEQVAASRAAEPDAAWRDGLLDANRRAWGVIADGLSRETAGGPGGALTEGAAVRTVVDRLPGGAVLAVGNSLPIREVDLFVPAGRRGLTVWSQRGANGIDGLISGAAGAAAASGRPTTLLLGDVSFLHDLGGLATLRDLPAPLTVVVLNNGGGRIFERLPIVPALAGDPALDAWLTPPRVDVRAAAEAFGVAYARATDVPSIRARLDELAGGGVLEVVIAEGGTTRHQQELRARIAAALELPSSG